MLWSLKEIYKALDLKMEITKDFYFKNISTDTRTISNGSFFIPIEGANFDGHKFVDQASDLGVKASLVEKQKQHLIKNKKIHQILVDNSKDALKKIAEYSRKRIKTLTVICITGSTGKTTLKEWTKEILKNRFIIHYSKGNFNNEIGMPITLANMPKKTRICILELGMNKPGEIDCLTKIAKPNISIITNIGLAHIGNFKFKDDIAKEKSDILNYLTPEGTAILPGDSDYSKMLCDKAKSLTKNVLTFGSTNLCDFNFSDQGEKEIIFSILGEKIPFKQNDYFINWKKNVVIILGLLKVFKLTLSDFKKFVEKLEPLQGRGEKILLNIKEKKILLIDESYNSSPNSLEDALINLVKLKSNYKRLILIIGDMLELGKMSQKFHLNSIKKIISLYPDLIITSGKQTQSIYEQLPKSFNKVHINNYKAIFKKLIKYLRDKDIIMIKGSNSTNLCKIINLLKEEL